MTTARSEVKSRSHHDVAYQILQPMSLPSINFLHLTVSKVQPGQDFSSHPPTRLPCRMPWESIWFYIGDTQIHVKVPSLLDTNIACVSLVDRSQRLITLIGTKIEHRKKKYFNYISVNFCRSFHTCFKYQHVEHQGYSN